MAKVAIDWDRDVNPNERIVISGEKSFMVVPQIITYGTYPIMDVIRDTVVKMG